ncbi:MAG TPA: hypothetical protein VGJ05_12640 [Fimbriiglobus sp.]|jgi:hypothetical protein
MIRFLAGVIVVLAGTTPGWAGDYGLMSLPELVARADVIVVGTVGEAGDPCRVTVTRTLFGTAKKIVEFPSYSVAGLREGDALVLFLTSGKKGLSLVYPRATRRAKQADEIARLLAMRADPAKYLADSTVASTPEFLETLGWAFVDRVKVGALDRKTVKEHLVQMLESREPKTVVTSMAALKQMGAKETTAVVPLIKNRDDAVQMPAIRFVAWAPDKAAVGPLCEVLDGIKGYSNLEEPIGRALMEIGDTAAVPALERAAGRGVYGATSWALGRLGDKKSCEVLMAGVDHDKMDALEGMMVMVRRSNKRFESWMGVNQWSEATGLKHKGD